MSVRVELKARALPRASDMAHIVLTFDDNAACRVLFGQYDQNLALIERSSASTSARAATRSRSPAIVRRRRAGAARARAISTAGSRRAPTSASGDVDGAIRMAIAADDQMTLPTLEPKGTMAARPRSPRASGRIAPAPPTRTPICARWSATNWCSASARPAPARPISRSPMRQCCSSAAWSSASSCRGRRSRPASGSASCPATCARRSIPICGRSTTRSTT